MISPATFPSHWIQRILQEILPRQRNCWFKETTITVGPSLVSWSTVILVEPFPRINWQLHRPELFCSFNNVLFSISSSARTPIIWSQTETPALIMIGIRRGPLAMWYMLHWILWELRIQWAIFAGKALLLNEQCSSEVFAFSEFLSGLIRLPFLPCSNTGGVICSEDRTSSENRHCIHAAASLDYNSRCIQQSFCYHGTVFLESSHSRDL